MGYCKHRWEDRTDVLREVFRGEPERQQHVFFVCEKCLRIDESVAEERAAAAPPGLTEINAA